MTTLLAVLLAVDAVLHGVIVARFGVKGNEPPFVFGIVYVGLSLAVLFDAPFALWVAFAVTVVGLAALGIAYKNIARDRRGERLILTLNPLIIVVASISLFAA